MLGRNPVRVDIYGNFIEEAAGAEEKKHGVAK